MIRFVDIVLAAAAPAPKPCVTKNGASNPVPAQETQNAELATERLEQLEMNLGNAGEDAGANAIRHEGRRA